ncbi:hypothetical protein TL16_g05320 [Triparma laevis f. inornata]|uniref:Uncharacterized protein n=1 Tax=Triparma laevis f. inornata TaxID=1714386 RepID=A0A9W7ALR8_9STRA|nr:hypothetical protein TL16_g05320 [Triparma laevis f. inornata]
MRSYPDFVVDPKKVYFCRDKYIVNKEMLKITCWKIDGLSKAHFTSQVLDTSATTVIDEGVDGEEGDSIKELLEKLKNRLEGFGLA